MLVGDVHGAALSLADPSSPAVQLGGDRLHGNVTVDGMAVVAVRGREPVVVAKDRDDSACHGLLAGVGVQVSGDFIGFGDGRHAPLEVADAHHPPPHSEQRRFVELIHRLPPGRGWF